MCEFRVGNYLVWVYAKYYLGMLFGANNVPVYPPVLHVRISVFYIEAVDTKT